MGATFAPKTMLALLVLGALNVLGVYGGDPVSVLSILKASKEAIESYDVERNMEIVHKHYFTTTKDQAIWHHIIREGKEIYATEFTLPELQFIEKLIQSVSTHYHSCMVLLPGRDKAQCFYHLSHMMADLEVGVRWELAPDIQLRPDEAKYGFFYHGVGMLTAHLSIIATEQFEYYKKVKLAKDHVKPFVKIMGEINANLYYHVKDVKIWLMDQVSPVSICQETEILWKTFTGSCETRWIGTAAKREDAIQFVKNLENKGPRVGVQKVEDQGPSRRAKVVVMPDSPEVQHEELSDRSYETDYFNVEDRSVMKILDQLGGHKGKTETRFHAKVEDMISKEAVFDEVMSATGTSKEEVMSQLAHDGLEARNKWMKNYELKMDLTKEATAMTKAVLNTAQVHVKTLFKDKFFPN